MEAFLGGMTCAAAGGVGAVFWYLLVHPDVLLRVWQPPGDRRDPKDWIEQHPGGVRALRWATGATLLLLGFLTGLVYAFLLSTR